MFAFLYAFACAHPGCALKEAEIDQSKNAASIQQKVSALRKQGKFAQAMQTLDKWVKICPDGAVLAARAAINATDGRLPKALDDYSKAIEREPC